MPVMSSFDSATQEATYLNNALENQAPYAPFAPLGTEKLNTLRKIAEIFQGQITPKNKLETTETRTKIV